MKNVQRVVSVLVLIHEFPFIGERPLLLMGGSRHHELMYNLGISLLHSGRPTQAFDFLIIAVRRYHRNCRLWLRLAECCIYTHKESNAVDFDIKHKQKDYVADFFGNGDNQKVILTTNLSKDKKYRYVALEFFNKINL